MNALNLAHNQAFSDQDENIQPDVYITYDAENDITIYFEDESIQLDLGYD